MNRAVCRDVLPWIVPGPRAAPSQADAMTLDQGLLFTILALALAGFIWGRFRYDMVAFAALFTATVLGLVPMDKAFSGFSDAAVVSVAAVFILTRALISSG